jgi:hypothetical protein
MISVNICIAFDMMHFCLYTRSTASRLHLLSFLFLSRHMASFGVLRMYSGLGVACHLLEFPCLVLYTVSSEATRVVSAWRIGVRYPTVVV